MIDDELESEDEFHDLMVRAGHASDEDQSRALSRYRERFPAFVKQGQREFLNRVAADLREVIERAERSPGAVARDVNAADWR